MSQARRSCFTKLYLKQTEFAYVSVYIKPSSMPQTYKLKLKHIDSRSQIICVVLRKHRQQDNHQAESFERLVRVLARIKPKPIG